MNFYKIISLLSVCAFMPAQAQSPGGVNTGLIIWMKAETGWTAANWTNQAPSPLFTSIPALNIGGTVVPAKINNAGFNFNDAIQFTAGAGNTTGIAYNTGNNYTTANFYGGTTSANRNITYFGVSNNGSFDLLSNFWANTTSAPCTSNRCNSGFRTNSVQFGNVSMTVAYPSSRNNIGAARRVSSSGRSSFINGVETSLATADSFADSGSYSFSIGYWPTFFAGYAVPEVLWYNRNLSNAEVNRVNSYLALKYGTTLTQTTAQNYTAGDGSTVYWSNANASAGGPFNYNIFGIGRDDASGLQQRISNSANNSGTTTISGSYLTISTNNNFTSANTSANHPDISANNNFLMISDNGDLLNTYSATISGIPNIKRSNRIWQAQKTGNAIGCVYYQFNSITNPTANQRYYLIAADDTAFTTNVSIKEITVSGGTSTVQVNQNTGSANYFTIGLWDNTAIPDVADTPFGIDVTKTANWKPTSKNGYIQINSVGKPVILSRVSSTSAITTPVEGMMIFDNSDNTTKVYNGTVWRALGVNFNRYCN
ncbi:hypothetical protein [Chryseobacterium shigense]|uniref:DUF8202 domain-containing protein n=1 Tax=Chryseobacterium shigense TaxID=297244 RepID=A0A841NJ80_9FLAO|nr:hypothetical protein [Chryseobacterium shigense]MBB6371309.1 hypothetical protein [Chryseobacterium shigense]